MVVDEAYNEYTDNPEESSLIRLINSHANLLVIRTFSKIYGLAALRIGYLLGNEG
ncbi:hypothetical protein N752_21555 [Desulforamulus aquiferis]|nr:hypothetical protein N752_21555 [Desulforamulus aquiferis]